MLEKKIILRTHIECNGDDVEGHCWFSDGTERRALHKEKDIRFKLLGLTHDLFVTI